MPFTPIVSSVLCLMRYHLGTVVKGAFIITLVEIPRLILTYIHSQLKGKVSPATVSLNTDSKLLNVKLKYMLFAQENACARCMLKACICCLWCLEKCLTYLNMVSHAMRVQKDQFIHIHLMH